MFRKFATQLAMRMYPDIGNGIIPHGFPMEELEFEYFDEMNFHYKNFVRISRDVARIQLKNFVEGVEKNYQISRQPNREIDSHTSRMQIPSPGRDIGNFDLSHSSRQQNSGHNAPEGLNRTQKRKRGRRGGMNRRKRLAQSNPSNTEISGNLSHKPETRREMGRPEHFRDDYQDNYDDRYELPPNRPHQMNFRDEPMFDGPQRDFHNNGPPRNFYDNEPPSPYPGTSDHREVFSNERHEERHDQRDLYERRSPDHVPEFLDQSQRNYHNNEPPRNYYDNGCQDPIPGPSNGSQRNRYDDRSAQGNYYDNEPPIPPQREIFDNRSPGPVPRPAGRPHWSDNCPPAPTLRPNIEHQQQPSERQSRNTTKQPEIDFQEVDIFFKSISQQIKRANLTQENFKDLQEAVYNAISTKIMPS